MSGDVAGARALLDQLDQARQKATPGVWKLWGMDVAADVDGTSNIDTATPVARTFYRDENGKPRTWDATLICDMHRAFPALAAALRSVLDLADELDGGAAGSPGLGVVAHRIRTAVTAAVGTP